MTSQENARNSQEKKIKNLTVIFELMKYIHCIILEEI